MSYIMLPEPTILVQPNIPPPMAMTNPRTILGQDWWDLRRSVAYDEFNNQCWACGVSREEAKHKQWLEAHEQYRIDYRAGRMVLEEVVALCHLCHNFIHSGRLLKNLQRGFINENFYIETIQHGLRVLGGALPHYHTVLSMLRAVDFGITPPSHWPDEFDLEKTDGWQSNILSSPAEWSKWRLVMGDNEYKPFFKNEETLKAYFAGDEKI